jgi:uncharacterized protein
VTEPASVGPPEPTLTQSSQPEPARDRPWAPLKPQDVLTGFGAIILGLLVAGGLVVAFVNGEPDRTLAGLVPQGLLFVGIPIAIAATRVSSRPWRVMGFVRFKASDLWLVLLGVFAQIVITVAFAQLFFTPEQDTLVEDVNFDETTFTAIATVFLIVVAAPITEETLFRGLFFGGLRTVAPFWVAAAVSGVIFGAVHLGSGDVAVAGLLAFFGVVLAWLYEKTGSLGPPILLHMLNNSLAIIPLLSS